MVRNNAKDYAKAGPSSGSPRAKIGLKAAWQLGIPFTGSYIVVKPIYGVLHVGKAGRSLLWTGVEEVLRRGIGVGRERFRPRITT